MSGDELAAFKQAALTAIATHDKQLARYVLDIDFHLWLNHIRENFPLYENAVQHFKHDSNTTLDRKMFQRWWQSFKQLVAPPSGLSPAEYEDLANQLRKALKPGYRQKEMALWVAALSETYTPYEILTAREHLALSAIAYAED